MAHEATPDMELNPLLADDEFQNKHSQRLFDVIDRLKSCDASQELELPEVDPLHPLTSIFLISIACHCWRSVRGQVVATSESYRHPLSGYVWRVYPISHAHCFPKRK